MIELNKADLRKYFEMADDLRESGRDLLRLAKGSDKHFVMEICGMKMLTAGNEFEKFLNCVADAIERMEDDGK